jgi:hypothetical protein
MRKLAISLIAMSALSASAFAATTGDFYCTRVTQSTASGLAPSEPIYFERAAKGCTSGQVEMEGVCQQQVSCAYVPAALKQQITQANVDDRIRRGETGFEATTLSFDRIPVADKVRLLNRSGVEWHPSTVTCKALSARLNGKTPICPAPNACKGDINYNPQEAMADPAGLVNDLNDTVRGGGVYKHDTNTESAR